MFKTQTYVGVEMLIRIQTRNLISRKGLYVHQPTHLSPPPRVSGAERSLATQLVFVQADILYSYMRLQKQRAKV